MVDLRRAVLATAALVYLTVLLGVSTKAAGAGLACNARWPLCDGGLLDLFPATVPSAFEWLHRVVAGVTGLAILGTVALAWREGASRGVRYATTAGLVLTPVQVYLGRETVLEFTSPVLAAHYWVAMGIFGSFAVAAALVSRDRLGPRAARRALALAALLVPLQVALSPLVVDAYSPPVQAGHYAVTLAVFAAAVVAAVARPGRRVVRYGVWTGLAGLPVLVAVGRQVLADPGLAVVYEALALGLFLAFAGAAVLARADGTT